MEKKFGLIGLSILTIVLFLSLTSAIAFTDSVTSVALNSNNNATFTLASDDFANFSFAPNSIVLTDSDGNEVTITITTTADTTNVTSVLYNAKATGAVDEFNFMESDSDTITFTITNTTDSTIDTKSIEFIFENKNICKNIQTNKKFKLEIEEMKVINGFGDKAKYWYLLDEIEVEVVVENDAWDLQDIEITWELYNTAGVKISSGDIDEFDLKDGKDKTVIFTFKIDEDIEDFEGENAILYIKAVGEVDEDSSVPEDGQDICSYVQSNNVKIKIDKDFVIATNFEIDNLNVEEINLLSCGEVLEIDAEIWNIGSRDQDDVIVEVYSKELGIDERFEFNTIDAFDKKTIQFELTVPKELQVKSYSLAFEVYDDGNDLFENSEDDKAVTYIYFKGAEDCRIEPPTLTASLEGEAKAGKEMIVKATIRNNDVKPRLFLISAEGYSSWAKLNKINPEFAQIASGESKEIEFTLTINKEIAEGDYTFNILSSVEGEEVLIQAVAVTVEAKSFSLKSLFENISKDFDWKLWGIIALNVILLVAIILVTGKILRKK